MFRETMLIQLGGNLQEKTLAVTQEIWALVHDPFVSASERALS